jgi:hypothetical protein
MIKLAVSPHGRIYVGSSGELGHDKLFGNTNITDTILNSPKRY